MSVINKMLKDLDQRQDAHNSTEQSNPSSPHNPNTNAGQSKSNFALLTFVLVIIAALLAFIGYQMLLNNSSRTAPSEIQISSNLPGTDTQASDQSQTDAIEEEADPDPASELPVAPAPESELPVNVDLVTVAEQVVPDETVATELPNDAEVTVTPETELVTETDSVEPTETTPAVTSESTSTSEPEVSSEPSFVIEKTSNKLTPEERVERLLNKAKSAYEKGYITEAIEDLTKLLSISDGNVEARTLLAGAWYGRGEGNRAIAILNDGLQRYPLVEEWRTTAAKIFFKENRLEGAFSYLNVELSGASKEFYTLKGNLARQLKQFAAAELAYDKLTKLEPFVGNWWLGLAIAQDSQAKLQQALASYIKVVETGGVSAQSLSFAQQRIEKLKG